MDKSDTGVLKVNAKGFFQFRANTNYVSMH